MKTIGIVGGLAWPSTAEYYRLINQEVSRLMGGSGRHCAKLVLAQTDFDAVERAQAADDWDAVAALIAEQVNILKAAGADFLYHSLQYRPQGHAPDRGGLRPAVYPHSGPRRPGLR
jgi:aspartate/glutamate racemase